MNRTAWKRQAGGFRAYVRKACVIGFHSAGVRIPSAEKPAGFDTPIADPLSHLAGQRAEHLSKMRADRAELARREVERTENARLGITHVASYIRSDELIRGGMEAARYIYLKNVVRREHMPLATLRMHELDLRIVQAFRRAA